jgi:aspartate kinase
MAEIESALAADKVVVVAGFQGIDIHGNITTLGRGGSDTTAVALASALNADECQIFTDVDGIYTADPKLVPQARKMKTVTFEEMLELSSLGAKVLQIRAVEFAGRYQLPVRVLSTFKEDLGTLITFENGMEQPVVSGIVAHQQEAKLVIRGIDDIPGVAARILTPISQANIEVDMITQSAVQNNNKTDLTFTVHQRDYKQALQLLTSIGQEWGAQQVFGDEQTAKLSLVGIGMRSHTPIASRMFEVLGQLGVNIQLLSTSETKVSVLLDEKYIEQSVRALHSAFNLHTASVKEHMVA